MIIAKRNEQRITWDNAKSQNFESANIRVVKQKREEMKVGLSVEYIVCTVPLDIAWYNSLVPKLEQIVYSNPPTFLALVSLVQ